MNNSLATVVSALLVASSGEIHAQGGAPATFLGNRPAAETRMFEGALAEIDASGERLAVAEATAARITESLAAATREAEIFRRQAGQLKLRLEALGVGDSKDSESKRDQRLLRAVSDLRVAETQRRILVEGLKSLDEAVRVFLTSAADRDPAARAQLEFELQSVTNTLGISGLVAGEAKYVARNPSEGEVIGVKPALALLVANIGTSHGVAEGMPFRIMRDRQQIGVARAVDVRTNISGLVVQVLTAESGAVQIGDRLAIGSDRPAISLISASNPSRDQPDRDVRGPTAAAN